jgi:hypothetical protein
MAKTAQKRGARVSAPELRELLDIEKRVMAGREKIVSGEEVMVQIMRGQVKASKPRRA